ncbi:MAG: hypothetical protein ACI88G_001681 [Woeseiaceae bacterium]|jgi:hypothetical protein
MKKVRLVVLSALCCGLFTAAQAQTLDMSGRDQASTFDQAGKPSRGMTQASVEANFGAPQSTRAAIGDPPISRWEYAGFVVFFEYDRVVHAVSKR